MNIIHVKVEDAGLEKLAEIRYEIGDEVVMELFLESLHIKKTASDFFNVLKAIRSELESRQIKLLCEASSKRAYPSRMTLQMTNGRKLYRLISGKQSLSKDLVDVFDPISSEDWGTIVEQRIAFEGWVKTLG